MEDDQKMEYLLQAKSLNKSYMMGDKEINALHDINENITSGEFILILGPSGSGKTTLLNILGLLDNPDSGDVYICENKVNFNEKNELITLRQKYYGFVFQTFNLLPVLTAIENVEMALIHRNMTKKQAKEMCADVLNLVGLSDRLHHYPRELSGGQQQRVSIARAIVGGPSILFADEPTANLDTYTAINILELLKKITEDTQMTIVVSTHDERIIKYSTRQIYLCDGEIIKERKTM
jgi:putative ABC transport system ATP-binding protein